MSPPSAAASAHRNPYVSAGPGDVRSPCPALNALANHSYIPHSGRLIPFFQLIHALRNIYNCSYPLAFVLSIVGFIWCGHLTGSWLSTRLALDLHDLARHGRIEHDGSLGHADVKPGEIFAPTVPDISRLTLLLGAGTARAGDQKGPVGVSGLTLFDLARVRYLRDAALLKPLDSVHAFITRGEVALILLAFGSRAGEDKSEDLIVPVERLAQWFADEKLPDGWDGPIAQIGLMNTGDLGSRVKTEVARIARYSHN